MIIIMSIITVLVASTIALLLNKLLASKIEKQTQRLGLQVVTFSVCIFLSIIFIIVGNLKTILNNFIDNKIIYIENELNIIFPNTNILDTSLDTTELVQIFKELHEIIESDKSKYGFFETIVINVFISKIKSYFNITENQINGSITIKSILLHIKEQTLKVISPYLMIIKKSIFLLLAIYIIIYISIVLFLKKGGGSYNKSIIFGNDAISVEKGMDDSQI